MKDIIMRPCPICGKEMEISGRRQGKGDEIFTRYTCTSCEAATAEAYAVEFLVENDVAFQRRWKRARKLN